MSINNPEGALPEPVKLSPEEREELSKLSRKLGGKEYNARLVERRGGLLTYAQRQASRRAKRVAAEKKSADFHRERQASVERRQRAFDLWAKGMSKAQVSVELGVAYQTVLNWLRGRPRGTDEPEPDPIDMALGREMAAAVADERMMARDEEEITIAEMAENHDKPADKYQAYVAATAIRLMRDNVSMVRGPRTVRELSELDQLIRRSLGLNPRGGSGSSGSLHIDISILNNTKASKGAFGPVVTVDGDPG